MTNSSAQDQTDLVPVYVPKDRVLDVYRFLGKAAKTGAIDESPEAEMEGEAEGLPFVPWTHDDLARLAATKTPGITTISSILDRLVAAGPGEWVSTEELAAHVGIDRNHIRGALSALTRHIKKHYGRKNWPFTFKWGPHLGKDGQAYYTVSPEVADLWTAVRAG